MILPFAEGQRVYSDFSNVEFKEVPKLISGMKVSAPPVGGATNIFCKIVEPGYVYLGIIGSDETIDNLKLRSRPRWDYLFNCGEKLLIYRTYASKGETFDVLCTGQFGVTTFFVAKELKLNPRLINDSGK
jgi:hypothetical protein